MSSMCNNQLIRMMFLPAFLIMHAVYGHFVLNVSLPERNNPVRATCSYSAANSNTQFNFFNPMLQTTTAFTTCSVHRANCLPPFYQVNNAPLYTFGVGANSAWVDIISLNRTRDQQVWSCILEDRTVLATLNLTVFTSPIGINFVSSLPTSIDLAETLLSVQCQTTECGYPAPTIAWYYETGTATVPVKEGTASVISSDISCSQDEQKYTTNLTLALGTVFPGNIPMTAKLRCGISHATFDGSRVSQLSVDVSFAVALTYVNISGTTNITEGTSATFTCITSISRPIATVRWYIGSMLITEGIQNLNRTNTNTLFSVESRLTFDPEGINHHGKNISCQAYTVDTNSIHTSDKLMLYVKVPLTYVNISGTTNITQGTAANFKCITSISRPEATVQWFIGNTAMTTRIQNIEGIDSSGLPFVESILTFDPDGITHHGKYIYCQAYNIDPSILTISAKPELFVRVYITSVTLNPAGLHIIFLDGEEKILTCASSPGRPRPIIRWWLDGSETKTGIINTVTDDRTLTIVSSELHLTLNKSHLNSHIYCDARVIGQPNIIVSSKPTVNIWYQPFLPSVQTVNGNFPWLENRSGILNCTTDDLGNPRASVTWSDSRGIIDTSMHLVFNNLSSQDHGQALYCQLQNNFTNIKGIHVVSPNVTLNVEFTSTISLNTSEPIITIEEGKTLYITCTASGNPTPVVQWQNTVPPSSFLYIPDIRRNNTGLNTCVASTKSTNYGGVLLSREKTVSISVQYAPVVRTRIDGLSQQSMSLAVICEAQGFPAECKFHPWRHVWGDIVIRSDNLTGITNSSQNILKLDSLSLQDMGTYICFADNGIKGLNGNFTQTSYVDLNVTGMPNILNADNSMFPGATGHLVNISIPFYSDPAVRNFTFKKNGTAVMNTSRTNICISTDSISYKFYNTLIKLQAQVAKLLIQNLTENDFDIYTLVLENSLGITEFIFNLSASGAPSKSERFYFNRFIGDNIELHFIPGFNGGLFQTFVIEYKSETGSDSAWKNTSVVDVRESQTEYRLPNGTFSVNVTQPMPGSYVYRMYSWNTIGRSPYSADITVFIHKGEGEGTHTDPTVAAIAGSIGSAAALMISAILVVIIIMKRRSYLRKKSCGLVENPIYDSSGPLPGPSTASNAAGVEYAAVVKHRKKAAQVEDPSKLYAQVNQMKDKINKKGALKGKHKKTHEDVYENATLAMKSTGNKFIYENSEDIKEAAFREDTSEIPRVQTSDVQVESNHGLMYADLMLGIPTTKNGKAVIWGIENCTEYAEIAYGKRGEPLPDRDEEQDSGAPKKKNDN